MIAMPAVIHVPACDSTQAEVTERLDAAQPREIVVVVTDHQRAGRGRHGRVWHDVAGGALLMSVGVRGPLPIVAPDLARRIAALVREQLLAAAGLAPDALQVSDPNDLVAADGVKVGGVLVDVRTTGGASERVIVGIGCNLVGESFLLGERRATTLRALGGRDLGSLPDRLALARTVAPAVAHLCSAPRGLHDYVVIGETQGRERTPDRTDS